MFDSPKHMSVLEKTVERVSICENSFHPGNGETVKNGLESHTNGKIETKVHDFTEAVDVLTTFMPDLVILDLDSLRRIDALNTALELRKSDENLPIIFMTDQPSIAFVRDGLISPLWHRAFWLEKPTRQPEFVLDEILDVFNGAEQLSSDFIEECIEQAEFVNRLTPQQHRVMRLMSLGASNLEIANECRTTEKAVERTISIASKLLNVEPASRKTNHRVSAANKYLRALFYTDSIAI